MKIRILSDLHLHINKENNAPNYSNDDILTIIAGDISDNIDQCENWLKKNFQRVIFIEGNHVAYSIRNKSLHKIYREYRKRFPINSNYSFLQNNFKIVDDCIFVGCTLWTDFSFVYPGTNFAPWEYGKKYLQVSPSGQGLYRTWYGKLHPFTVKFLKHEHDRSIKFIKKICKKFADRKIVLIVHHAISPQAVAPEFANYPYHSASINDHEGLIKQYQNLKIVIHGHVHQTHQYMIGNTSVYCNPLGIAIKNENPDYIKNLIIDI